ncbi:MAG: hypothetical protein M3301_03465 [Chloroflexota bacterium]|nr:hypothetical protein [Chloroflexota bacterium]
MAVLNAVGPRVAREQSGATLIEVMVSAMLVAMLAVGVLRGLDAANANSGNNKARAVAADLAQQDQERLRAYRAKELSNARETRTRTVAGVPYTVTSRADWVSDTSGTQSCSGSSARADYLKISSTVTWPQMYGAKPVSVHSLVAPPNGSFGSQGSLAVQVLNRSGAGVTGVAVEVSGPKAVGGTTDSAGCVFFGFLTAGNYTVKFSKPGYVDANGVNQVVRTVGVQDEVTQNVPIDYDLAGGMTINVDTKRLGVTMASKAAYVSVGHSQLASPGARVFGNGSPASSFSAGSLFPFPSAYAVYAGNCTGANPSNLPPPASVAPGLVTITPGATPAVTVRQPAVQLMRYLSGNTGSTTPLPQGSRVTLVAKSLGCGGKSAYTTDTEGFLSPTPATSSVDPGVPYGTYDVCAVYAGTELKLSGVAVDVPDGKTVNLSTNGAVAGTCP